MKKLLVGAILVFWTGIETAVFVLFMEDLEGSKRFLKKYFGE